MTEPTLDEWAAHLRRIAEPAAAPHARLGAGALDAPFRGAVCGADAVRPAGAAPTGEIALWWARLDGGIDVDAVLAAAPDEDEGPLLPRDLYSAIEVQVDAELAALHALWWLARRRGRADWSRRVATARAWHLLNTQPDNATNRPWALHVFLLGRSPECTHYAGTLLHNCLAANVRPDPLSAWILIDAARGIEQEIQERDDEEREHGRPG